MAKLIYIIGLPVSLYLLWAEMIKYFFGCIGGIILLKLIISIAELFEKRSKGD